jgi:hypothetical protein
MYEAVPEMIRPSGKMKLGDGNGITGKESGERNGNLSQHPESNLQI